jgi:superfamily II DNA/RNA helicase
VSTRSFADLGVPTRLTDALRSRGILTPTPIQAATLPDSLAGRDVLGRGRTGSGKTYAFLLPLVAGLTDSPSRRGAKRPRSLILAPTRELAGQIAESLQPLAQVAGLRSTTVFGGVGKGPQIRALSAGVDVLIACPGRLEDLMSTGDVMLDAVEVTILDEADHMADLGFLPGVKRIMDRTPRTGQRMLFSATLDGGIDVLVRKYLTNPVSHSADSAQSPVSTMEHHVLHIAGTDRLDVLADLASAPGRSLVFTRTKHGAKKLAKQLNGRGVPAVELHGNLAQNARTRNLEAFHSGRAATLVATDIAARGIHVDDVGLVIHADPPVEHKAYLHRSGRTARAGASGRVVTLMTDEQQRDVRALTKAAGVTATTTRVAVGHPLLTELAPRPAGGVAPQAPIVFDTPAQPQRRSGGNGGGRRQGSGSGRSGSSRSGAGRGQASSGRGQAGSPGRGQRSGGGSRRGSATAAR